MPTGWTLCGPAAPGGNGFWINSDAYAHSGNNYWKEWGANWNAAGDVAGTCQEKACSPGWTYVADAWFFTLSSDAMGSGNKAWVEVSFRDSTGTNVLALYKTGEFTAAWGMDTWFDLGVTNACDPAHNNVVTGVVSQLVAPAGTATVRFAIVHFHNAWDGGSFYLDDAVLNQVSGPVPPVLNGDSELDERPRHLLLHWTRLEHL